MTFLIGSSALYWMTVVVVIVLTVVGGPLVALGGAFIMFMLAFGHVHNRAKKNWE